MPCLPQVPPPRRSHPDAGLRHRSTARHVRQHLRRRQLARSRNRLQRLAAPQSRHQRFGFLARRPGRVRSAWTAAITWSRTCASGNARSGACAVTRISTLWSGAISIGSLTVPSWISVVGERGAQHRRIRDDAVCIGAGERSDLLHRQRSPRARPEPARTDSCRPGRPGGCDRSLKARSRSASACSRANASRTCSKVSCAPLFTSRSWMTCQPKSVLTGALISPGFIANSAFSNGPTIMPLLTQPRSPPAAFEPVSSLLARASAAKSAPGALACAASCVGLLLGRLLRGGIGAFRHAHQDVRRQPLLGVDEAVLFLLVALAQRGLIGRRRRRHGRAVDLDVLDRHRFGCAVVARHGCRTTS